MLILNPVDESLKHFGDQWINFLPLVRRNLGVRVEAALRGVRDIAITKDTVVLAFGSNDFTREMIVEAETNHKIAGLLSEILGRSIKLECQWGEYAKTMNLDNYDHIKPIGEGHFSIVKEYRNKITGQAIAIKQLKKEYYKNEDYINRFCREIAILERLADYPHVIKLLDYSQSPGLYAYAMPLATINLQRYIERKNNSLELKNRLLIFERVLGAIRYAHQNGVLHRDISPNNVLLFDNSGIMEVVVADFGLGKSTEAHLAYTQSSVSSYGQMYYVAPEQREKLKSASFKSDVYSLGKLLNFILTGKIPEIVHPTEFAPIIKKATEYNPDNRYSTIDEFHDAYQTLKSLIFSTVLPVTAELEQYTDFEKVDWHRIHLSLMFDYSRNKLFNSYVEPVLHLFNKPGALQEYYAVVGTTIGDFIAKFIKTLEELPQIGWSFSATGDFAILFYNVFMMVKEVEIKLDCLKGLWYWAYIKNQHDVQVQLSKLLEHATIPTEIQTEFATYILQSNVVTRSLEVPYSSLVKMNLPQVIRNAIIRKSI